AALAGPLIVTRTQRQAWNDRVVRAIVAQGGDGARRLRAEGSASLAEAVLSQTFETAAVSDAIPRAVVWLESAPPARRELLIVGPLALGSVSAEDLAVVPPDIGIRFEQSGGLPAERGVAGGRVLATKRDPSVHSSERERRQLPLEREGFSRANEVE